MQNKAVRWIIYTALSIVVAPAIVFNAGFLLVGDYEGDSGFLGFFGAIYGAAMSGSVSAWTVLLGPILAVVIWLTVIKSWQALAEKSAPATAQSAS
jgi:hypothetical protein